MSFNFIKEESKIYRRNNFSTRIFTKDEILVFAQFKRGIGFTGDYLVGSFDGNIAEANAYLWKIPIEKVCGKDEIFERLEWSGAIFKMENGWHLTAKGLQMRDRLAREGRFRTKKKRSKPVRIGRKNAKTC